MRYGKWCNHLSSIQKFLSLLTFNLRFGLVKKGIIDIYGVTISLNRGISNSINISLSCIHSKKSFHIDFEFTLWRRKKGPY
jgi:hypothetical protein